MAGMSTSSTGVRSGSWTTSITASGRSRSAIQALTCATAAAMWPLAAQSGSKVGDTAGIATYSERLGRTASSHSPLTVLISAVGSTKPILGGRPADRFGMAPAGARRVRHDPNLVGLAVVAPGAHALAALQRGGVGLGHRDR